MDIIGKRILVQIKINYFLTQLWLVGHYPSPFRSKTEKENAVFFSSAFTLTASTGVQYRLYIKKDYASF